MGVFITHTACPDCGGSDSLAIHEEEDGTYNGTCWSKCTAMGNGYKSHNKLAGSEVGSQLGITPIKKHRGSVAVDNRSKKISLKKKKLTPVSQEMLEKLREMTVTRLDAPYRSIESKWYEMFRCRFSFDEESGDISAIYYPVTKGLKNDKPALMGFHKRVILPNKDFRAYPAGSIGKECDMFGKFLWKNCSRLVITGGEQDTIAAKKMHEEYRNRQQRKGKNISEIDFTSSITGEGVAAEQVRLNYDDIDKYDEIILDMDGDEAGESAESALLDVLPVSKVKVMRYSSKDANAALIASEEAEYIGAIYQAKKPKLAGIHGGIELLEDMYKESSFQKLPLPEFMEDMNRMLEGGYNFGTFNIIAGDTSVGKCHGKDVPILMQDTTTKMSQDVEVGDVLMGPDGSPRKVISTHTGVDTMYKVTQIKGMSYTVNSEHLLSLKVSPARTKGALQDYSRGDVVNIPVKEYLKLPKTNQTMLKGYKGDLTELGKHRNSLNTGVTVTELGKDNYYGFEVDGDHLYCLGDMTVTHNSTLVNEMAQAFIVEQEHKPVILSLEARKGVLTRQYLSLTLGKRLGEFKTPEEMREYIQQHQKEVDKFLTNEDGENTFEVIDDRARLISVDDTFKMIERAIISLGCSVVIIDVLTDLMDSLTIEEQAMFNGRIKAMIATHNICIIGIMHTRKLEGRDAEGNQRIEPTRHDVYGSKTTIGSATTLLLIWRDLQANEYEERNTTYSKLDKNRDHSSTGPSGQWVYDRDKHKMMNKYKKSTF